MINWSPLGPCDLNPYKLSISVKSISATPSLDILKKKFLSWISYTYILFYIKLQRKTEHVWYSLIIFIKNNFHKRIQLQKSFTFTLFIFKSFWWEQHLGNRSSSSTYNYLVYHMYIHDTIIIFYDIRLHIYLT